MRYLNLISFKANQLVKWEWSKLKYFRRTQRNNLLLRISFLIFSFLINLLLVSLPSLILGLFFGKVVFLISFIIWIFILNLKTPSNFQESKEERKRRFKGMTSKERRSLIRRKMKLNGIIEGSGIPNKIYDSREISDLIKILNCFPELKKSEDKKI